MAQAAADQPAVRDQGAEAVFVIERPPPGLARGEYAWPPWAIGLLGGSAVLVTLTYLTWRVLRARKR